MNNDEYGQRNKIVTARIPWETYRDMRYLAIELGVTNAQVIVMAIEALKRSVDAGEAEQGHAAGSSSA